MRHLALSVLVVILVGLPCRADEAAAAKVVLQAEPFELADVRLLDGPFREAMLRDRDYLLSLEPDRLLYVFRATAGLPPRAEPYGGWETPACEVVGHSLGHYLSACSLMFAATGDARLKERVDAIVPVLAECQEALPKQGYHPGFLAAFPESFFDRVDRRERVWAPYYTLHKIMAGLLDAHLLCGNQQALGVLERMADWLAFRVGRLSHDQMQRALDTEHGGMNEVLANLYAVTGNPEHLKLARAFNHEVIFDPLARHEDKLDGLHANTQIPKIIGAARQYELTGDRRLHDVATFFWRRVALHRSYVIGGHSDHEHFFPVDQFSQHLSPDTCETCNTYNMLKLTRHLFAWEPSAETMDFYERALYNHILASQDPDKETFVYLMSLKPGHFKTYSTPTDSFWCCVGTGMENHAKYADTIYFHGDDTLYVNLFIASELTWKEKGLVLGQETAFPQSGTTRLTLRCERPLDLAMKIRSPAWASGGITVAINGTRQEIEATPGTYVTLRRQWHDGDAITVDLPMSLRLEPLPGNPNTVAVLYGPVVLAGELGTEGMPNPYATRQTEFDRVPSPQVPVFVTDAKGLLAHLAAVPEKPLTFRTEGVGRPRDVTLIPFYRMHHQRYSVYWDLVSEGEWTRRQAEMLRKKAEETERRKRLVDELVPGDEASEAEHKLEGHETRAGAFQGRKWRHATAGGWFSFQMKTLANQPVLLVCTYWGSDHGRRQFDVLVDGRKIATQTLENNRPGEFFDVEYPIPTKLTEGKNRVTVKLQAQPGKMAGGLFGAQVLKLKK